MSKVLHVLLIMDPQIPVPPPFYGGHERLVSMFVEEYTRLGHKVTLLAGPNSKAPTVRYFGRNNSDLNQNSFRRSIEVLEAWRYILKNCEEYDLVHNFGRLLYLLPILNNPVKKIMTYGRDVTGSAIRKTTLLPNKNLVFTACSNYCVSTGNVSGNWKTVYNAIDFSKYTLQENVEDDAPLIFLGRIEQIKGVHSAIQVALQTDNKLWIAGNIAKEHIKYFKTQVEPFLDGEQIKFLGPLNDEQKNEYLGKSKALLFPIEWDEPFGMVMVEAMACGTPVLALRRGSVPEVILEAKNGFTASSLDVLVGKIPLINKLDRKECRRYALERFDVKVIAAEYLNIFNFH